VLSDKSDVVERSGPFASRRESEHGAGMIGMGALKLRDKSARAVAFVALFFFAA